MASVEEDVESEEEETFPENDPFAVHFETVLQEEDVAALQAKREPREQFRWACVGNATYSRSPGVRTGDEGPSFSEPGFEPAFLKDVLRKNLESAVKLYVKPDKSRERLGNLSLLQLELLTVMGSYCDLYYPERTFQNGDDVCLSYCLHVLNHVLKARSRVMHHNAKLKRHADGEYRDRGLTRPKVLIVLPFKSCALKVVKFMSALLFEAKRGNVMNKKRFQTEYGAGARDPAKLSSRPEDFEALFGGNVDDAFRIGLAVTRKSLKLYAEFYSADIVVASPLGLKRVVGSDGDKRRDYDFLSSVEILVLDQADVFLMQNPEDVLHLMRHLHLQPRESHDVDFSRVRTWALNGWSKYYRQTLMFGSMITPILLSTWNRQCWNYGGSILVRNPIAVGSVSQIVVQLPQVFQRFEAASPSDVPDARFNLFVDKILPHHKDPAMSHTLVFIPSYFDFVRVRNRCQNDELGFDQICEHTDDGRVAQARDLFFHGKRHFLLYTERFHFFRRHRIKGIRHIVFYELPTYPHFYSEVCNFLHVGMRRKTDAATDSNISCTVLYSRYDVLRLEAVVGSERAAQMVNSDKRVHLFVT